MACSESCLQPATVWLMFACMAKHEFGGDWTTEKLQRVRMYLSAYTKIFKTNPRARYFSTIYVDAFAGTGHRVDSRRPSNVMELFEEADPDAEAYKDGSVKIALESVPPFDRFVFIERDADRLRELRAQVANLAPNPDTVQVVSADANIFLRDWCEKTDWRAHRAVVFLDPYGMQVEWTTLVALAGTGAVDLWLLFPLGVAVNRLLTRDATPPRVWADALTRIFSNA